MSRVLAVAPALPPNIYPQHRISEVIGPLLTGDQPGHVSGRGALLERLHAACGVSTRHLALPLEDYAGLTDFGERNDLFIRLGLDLAEQAARAALAAAGLAPQDVDHLLFTTVTGVSAPSLDALLVPRLGLRPDVRRMPSFGLGCAAGAAGLARVHDYLAGHPDHVALLVSVELCSLTIQHGDCSTANLVSSGLFGDGAAAVVMVGDAHPAGRRTPSGTGGGEVASTRRPTVVDTRSRLYPGTSDHLGWQVGGTGFRIVLAAGLPDVIAAHLGEDVAGLLDEHDLKVRDVSTWVVHAGGPKVLGAVQEALDLDDCALSLSRASLAAAGNLSSASVLHVLGATMEQRPEPGSPGVLMAFGPGVGAELVLLRWDDDGWT